MYKSIDEGTIPKTERNNTVLAGSSFNNNYHEQMTYTTQTTSSKSSLPSVNIGTISAKLKDNHKEIKRIEAILYKKDKHTEKKNSLAQKSSITDFEKKAQEKLNSRRGTKILADEVSLQKLIKMDKIDKKY